MKKIKTAQQSDTIKYALYGKIFTAKVAIVNHERKEYGVYAEYGQDFIPFDKCEIINKPNK